MASDEAAEDVTGRPEEIRAVPLRHPGRWIAAVFILVLSVLMVRSAIVNANYEWSVVWDTLFTDAILRGVLATLLLTAVAMAIGVSIGVGVAIMRLSENPLVWGAGAFYAWLFRGVPVLVQLLFWFFIAALYPKVGIDPVNAESNALISVFMAAILGLGLSEAAYMSEIVRAGIISVDEGQVEAAKALGMTRTQTLRRVVLPQAMRVIVPPTGNETISMLKTSSLVSVIAYTELLYAGQIIYGRDFKQIPVLLAVSIWYLFMTSLLSVGQYYIERHYGRGSARHQMPTPLQRLRRNLFGSSRGEFSQTDEDPPGVSKGLNA